MRMDKIDLNCYLFWALLTWLRDDCPLLERRNPGMPQGYFCPFISKNSRVVLRLFLAP